MRPADVVMGTTSTTVDQGPSYGSRTCATPARRSATPQPPAGRRCSISPRRISTRRSSQLVAKDGTISVARLTRSLDHLWRAGGRKAPDMRDRRQRRSLRHEGGTRARTKDPSDIHGRRPAVARKDIPGKMTGAVHLHAGLSGSTGMLHGRVVRPVRRCKPALRVGRRDAASRTFAGFVQVVRRDNFLGVVAETEWGAIQAARSSVHPEPDRPGCRPGQVVGLERPAARWTRSGRRCARPPAATPPSPARDRWRWRSPLPARR